MKLNEKQRPGTTVTELEEQLAKHKVSFCYIIYFSQRDILTL